MEQPRLQFSVAALLGVVACVAVNVWLFRLGALWGILGLNVTKHVLTAYLCQILGIDGRSRSPNSTSASASTTSAPPAFPASTPALPSLTSSSTSR